MKRIDENTVELTPDEQIIGDFFAYLVEELGMTPGEARGYLGRVPRVVTQVLTTELRDYVLGRDKDGSHEHPDV